MGPPPVFPLGGVFSLALAGATCLYNHQESPGGALLLVWY